MKHQNSENSKTNDLRKPIKKLTLVREEIRALHVRTSVRAGDHPSSYTERDPSAP